MGVYGGPKNRLPGSKSQKGTSGGREIGTKPGLKRGLPK